METVFTPLKYGVGIDMGKEKFAACLSAIDTTGRIKIKATHSFANSPKGHADFDRWCTHHGKHPHVPTHYLMEATGVYYEHLALALHQKGAHVCVILPQKAKYYVKALGIKTKTDGVDAQALATMVCQQRLEVWRPISQAMYELRQLTRQQADLQVFKTKVSNHLMSLEQGIYQAKEVKRQMAKLLAEIEKQIDECEKLIAKAIAQNAEWKRKVEQICAIKGVGLLTVAHLITETNEFALFENQRQLVSYAGYDVVENQSGKRVGKTRISKRGNARIRRGLHMASLMVVRYEQRPFVGLYERVFERTKVKMKGYVAVQRKLLTLIYALWKKDEKYDGNFVSAGQKKVAPTKGATLHRPQADVLEGVNIGELVES
ncbi:IS110 family transposase [Spirosoma sp. SC4-14]|uniref:IS110 family transposase n=1 Tax=Spirosoma sp. SC4-14 TaxID=3128900 RepID=UPI0030D4EFA9